MTQPRDAKGRFVSTGGSAAFKKIDQGLREAHEWFAANAEKDAQRVTLEMLAQWRANSPPMHPADAISAVKTDVPAKPPWDDRWPPDAISAEPQKPSHPMDIFNNKSAFLENLNAEPYPGPAMREEWDDDPSFWLWFVVAVMFVMLMILGWELMG